MRVSVDRQASVGFSLALVLLTLIAYASYRSISILTADAAAARQTQEILTLLESVALNLVDAETGTRGFVITGNETYLEPYHRAVQATQPDLDRLRAMLAGRTDQISRLDSLNELARLRLERAGELAELRRTQGFEAAQELSLTGRGRELQDRVRRTVQEMVHVESVALGERIARTRTTTQLTRTVILLGSGVAFGIAGFAMYVIRRDLAGRRQAEADLRAAHDFLARERDRAEAADRVKSAFLATMSHELRTPLNSIIGFVGVLLKGLAGPLSEEQLKQLEMVRGSARHLLALINDVLDISKIEAGEVEVRLEPFDLRASIADVVNLVRPLAEKKRLDLRVDVADAVGTMVSDERRVEQILLNLLNNAVKFTETGTVRMAVDLDGEEQARMVRVQVIDTGIGIKPEDLETLFKPFKQVDSTLSRHHEGTGLGLAICRRLAGMLGGDISVRSAWGRGSTFIVTLPLTGRGVS